MTQTFVHDRLTRAEPETAVVALCEACIDITQVLPTAQGLACHVAQSALETGHWRSCHWWNFGNVKASSAYNGMVTYFGCNEVIKGKTHWFHPSPDLWTGTHQWVMSHMSSKENNSQCRWRAYSTIREGAVAQLAFLARVARYSDAWAQGLRGDPEAFSAALKRAGYYTASEAHYTRLIRALYNKYFALCEKAVDEISESMATPADPVPNVDVEPEEIERLSARLDDEYIRSLFIPLGIPWDEMRDERRAEVLALDE